MPWNILVSPLCISFSVYLQVINVSLFSGVAIYGWEQYGQAGLHYLSYVWTSNAVAGVY